jgi:cell division protein FtsI (penicillin-binding protein 3)
MRSNVKFKYSDSSNFRFPLVKGFVLFLFALLAARLVYVQGFLRTELKDKASRQFVSSDKRQSFRGRIVDSNKTILAEMVQVYSCYADPTLIKDKNLAAKRLSSILHENEGKLFQRIKSTKGSFVWIKRRVTPHEAEMLQIENIPGLGLKTEWRRHYPEGPLAPHILGLVGLDGKGLSGVESKFEKVMADVRSKENGSEWPSGHLELTLDSNIQQIVEKELRWGVQKINAKRGMVIVQNPWTGDVLAASAWPAVSLDADNPSDPKEMRIPVLVDVFEPGSTFKIVTAAAAIEKGAVSDSEVFDGEKGKWKVSTVEINDHEPLKKMTFEDIMVHSSNIGTAKIADRLGSGKMYQYSRLFGFGVFPGSGISGEAKGILRHPSEWSGVSKYAVSFGQEVGVTAIQLAGAYSTIANGGYLMEPRIVKGILSDEGEEVWEASHNCVRRVLSGESAKRLTEMLKKVVEKGTGINAQIQWDPSTSVAGKTGTAQKFNVKKRKYDENLTLVSFCGFFPADSPQFTMVVILDEPEGRRWGGLDAAPVFRRIAEQISPLISVYREKNSKAKEDRLSSNLSS